MNITGDECAVCGSDLELVRPGKWQCPKCELDNMLKQAHREGWEQCQYQALTAMRDIDKSTKDYEETFEKSYAAIAAMEYKEKANDR